MSAPTSVTEIAESHIPVTIDTLDGPIKANLVDKVVNGMAHVAVEDTAGQKLFDTTDYTHLEPGVSPMASKRIREVLAPLLRSIRYSDGDFVFPHWS